MDSIHPEQDLYGAIGTIRADQHEQALRISGVSHAMQTLATEVAGITERLRRVEESVRQARTSLSELETARLDFERAIMAHVTTSHQNLMNEMDGQNVELRDQSEKLDQLLGADCSRREVDAAILEKIKMYRDIVGILGGLVGLISAILGAILWMTGHK